MPFNSIPDFIAYSSPEQIRKAVEMMTDELIPTKEDALRVIASSKSFFELAEFEVAVTSRKIQLEAMMPEKVV